MSAVVLESLMGYIISRTNVEPFIITLGGMITFQGIALLLCNSREVIMNGELDFFKVNLIQGAKDPVSGLNLIIPPYVVIFFVIALLAGLLLDYTKYGRRIYAVGTNPYAAYLAGINVKNMKLSVYVIMGFLVGIGAVMLLSRVNTGIITLGQGLEIDSIAMVVIGGTALKGGKGNIVGTLIGVFFLGSIGNAMNMLRLPSEVQFVAKGLVVIIAVSAGDVSSRVSGFMSRRKELRLGRSTTGGERRVRRDRQNSHKQDNRNKMKESVHKQSKEMQMKRPALLLVCFAALGAMNFPGDNAQAAGGRQEGHWLLHGRLR